VPVAACHWATVAAAIASPAATAERSAGSGGISARRRTIRYSVGDMHSVVTASSRSSSTRCCASKRASWSTAVAPRSQGAMNALRADFDQPAAAVHHATSPGRASNQCSACSD
jgi:hypothetical protein